MKQKLSTEIDNFEESYVASDCDNDADRWIAECYCWLRKLFIEQSTSNNIFET